MQGIASVLDAFAALRVLVVGDAMLDVYLHGTSSRLCQEAPVPIVDLTHRYEVPGGAANVAVNVQCLGASIEFLSVLGNDPEGMTLRQALERCPVDTQPLLNSAERRTLCKQRVSAGGQVVVRCDQGDTDPLSPQDEAELCAALRRRYAEFDAVILSDYNYGIFTPAVIATLAELQRKSPTILVGDSKCLQKFGGLRFTAVKPNYGQAAHLLGACPVTGPARIDQMLRLGPQIFKSIDTRIAAITLDQDGAIVFEQEKSPLRTFTRPSLNSRAAGAGDTYVAALTLALAAGADTQTAAQVASTAAAVVVGHDGTTSCDLQTLRQQLSGRHHVETNLDQLALRLDEHRRRGQRIVLTNGCFDLLHRGHITYLNQARALGDVLVVGVNSDDSIRRLKGPERPINSLEDRLQVLAALDSVDYVIPFDDDTPHRLVRGVRPHVFVKGGDYTLDRLPEASLVKQLGGRVEILPLVRERSTTSLIKRIRSAPPAGDPWRATSSPTEPSVPLARNGRVQ